MIVKGVVLADIHFGALDTSETFREWEKFLIPTLEYIQPQYGVICGDLFHYKMNVNSEDFRNLLGCMFMLAEYCPETEWHIIEGTRSHDGLQNKTLETIFENVTDLFEESSDLEILENRFHFYYKVTEANICGLNCLMIPEEYVEDKGEFYKEYFNKKYDMVFGHGMTDMMYYAETKPDQMKNVPGSPVFKVSELLDIGNYVFFGHIHTHKISGNFESVGSLMRLEFGTDAVGFDEVCYDPKTELAEIEYFENNYALEYVTDYIDVGNITFAELNRKLAAVMDKAKNFYKMKLVVFLDGDVKGCDKKTLATDYIPSYFESSNIFVTTKVNDKYYEDDGYDTDSEGQLLCHDPNRPKEEYDFFKILADHGDVTIQKFIKRTFNEDIGIGTVREIIGEEEEVYE